MENLLIKEAHHRIKNSLQLVISLLQLQGRQASQETCQELREASSRIQAIAHLHGQLSQNPDVLSLKMADYIKSICHDFQIMTPQCQFHFDVQNITLPADIGVSIGLILTEAVMNSIKHASPQSKDLKIDISLYSQNKEVVLIARDYGSGILENFSQQDNQETFGFRIINEITESIQAKINFESAKPGMRLSLRVPLSHE